jgi:hypothetical protein
MARHVPCFTRQPGLERYLQRLQRWQPTRARVIRAVSLAGKRPCDALSTMGLGRQTREAYARAFQGTGCAFSVN